MINLRRTFFERAADRMPSGMRPSPFTDRADWLGQGAHTFAVTNGFPSTPGHTLILPRDFGVYRFFELARDEIIEHHRFLKHLSPEFNAHFKPDGYNIGWNVEFCGGQSIAHAHMHIMPRYHAVNKQHGINPAGGVARMPFPSFPDFYAKPDKRAFRAMANMVMTDMPRLSENDHAFAVSVPRSASVARGHSWIISGAAGKNVFDAGEDSFAAQLDLALDLMVMQQAGANPPDGYNIGWDVGTAAGQVMERNCLQLIPRYKGDMNSPRGGIVRVIPPEAWPKQTDYYDAKNAGKDVVLTEKVLFPFHFWTDSTRTNTLDLGPA